MQTRAESAGRSREWKRIRPNVIAQDPAHARSSRWTQSASALGGWEKKKWPSSFGLRDIRELSAESARIDSADARSIGIAGSSLAAIKLESTLVFSFVAEKSWRTRFKTDQNGVQSF